MHPNFYLLFLSCEREFFSHSVAIRSQKPHGPAGRKDNGGEFKTPGIWQGLGQRAAWFLLYLCRASFGGTRGAPGARDAVLGHSAMYPSAASQVCSMEAVKTL